MMKKRRPLNSPIQAGGGSELTSLPSAIKYIEINGTTLEVGSEKSWSKIAEIEVQENDSVYEYTDLDDLTEIFIYTVGLCNITTTASAVMITINNVVTLPGLDTQNTSGSETKYQRVLLKNNGLFWDVLKTNASNTEANYYNSSGPLSSPYSVKLNVGKCTKLNLRCNGSYYLKSGKIYIYGR